VQAIVHIETDSHTRYQNAFDSKVIEYKVIVWVTSCQSDSIFGGQFKFTIISG